MEEKVQNKNGHKAERLKAESGENHLEILKKALFLLNRRVWSSWINMFAGSKTLNLLVSNLYEYERIVNSMLKSVSKKCAVLMAFMWEQGLRSYMNSPEPGSHMLAKKTAYLFDADFNNNNNNGSKGDFTKHLNDSWYKKFACL